MPFNVEYIIRAWDKTRDGLAAKTAAIKNAINGMNGAQYLVSAADHGSETLFPKLAGLSVGPLRTSEALRGNTLSRRRAAVQRHVHRPSRQAEAIYDGTQRNLVGVTTFSGSQGNETPQHAVLLGMSGAGKSVTVCDLLSQTEAFFDYTVIIEEGLSYEIYTRTVEPNARPIIIQPDGDLTINYLDTHGLPLTAEHLSSAMALVAKIARRQQQTRTNSSRAKRRSRNTSSCFTTTSSRNGADETPTAFSKSPATPAYLRS